MRLCCNTTLSIRLKSQGLSQGDQRRSGERRPITPSFGIKQTRSEAKRTLISAPQTPFLTQWISGCRSPRNHHARADADAAVQLDANHQFERIALLCRILKDEPALRPSSPNPLKILPVAEAVSKQPRFQTRRAKQKRHRTGRNRRHRCSCQP